LTKQYLQKQLEAACAGTGNIGGNPELWWLEEPGMWPIEEQLP
jgi:hypothetical protein